MIPIVSTFLLWIHKLRALLRFAVSDSRLNMFISKAHRVAPRVYKILQGRRHGERAGDELEIKRPANRI